MTGKRRSIAERFWAKVDMTAGETGCWLWTGATQRWGYGVLQRGGRGKGLVAAHRLAYELCLGTVPEGLCVLHRCDTPACVNPAHLFLGTLADNSQDMAGKGRCGRQRYPQIYPRGERIAQSKLTEAQVKNIRIEAAQGESQRTIARRYDVAQSTIGEILLRRTWRWVNNEK